MINLDLEKIILNTIASNGKFVNARCTKAFLQKRGWLSYLVQRYIDNTATDPKIQLREILYRLNNNIEIAPVCKICGNPIIFKDKEYASYCSQDCINKDPEVLAKNSKSNSETQRKRYAENHDEIVAKINESRPKTYNKHK